MTYLCRWHDLMRSLATYTPQPYTPQPCWATPTHYVLVRVQTEDYDAELLRNLCAEHEEMARRLDGWAWSRKKQVVPA
ncbi:MAG: hypothetical protein IRZ05_18865 [Micromonosporaceae bacterium]|nr:hypothetical protein [Micromonosporaceae bacterium]